MALDFDTYQDKALKTALYPDQGHNIAYPALGLTGEAGEVAERVKKVFRDFNGELTPEQKVEIATELGDVLWYIAALSKELGIPLSKIAEYNIKKLKDRYKRGVLHGDGDHR
jgi:NTP pyrophosphatase (non-canonical NTP hydrolase)